MYWLRQRLPRHSATVAAAAVLSCGVLFAASHYGTVDQSDYYMTEDWARAILSPLPPNALLLLKSDHIDFPIRYLQFVEQYRVDVQALDLDLLTYRWMKPHQKQHTPLVEWPGRHYSVSEPDGTKAQLFTLLLVCSVLFVFVAASLICIVCVHVEGPA